MTDARKREIELNTLVVREGIWKCCLNCEHWSTNSPEGEKKDTCHKFDAVPPYSVVIVGCEQYSCELVDQCS